MAYLEATLKSPAMGRLAAAGGPAPSGGAVDYGVKELERQVRPQCRGRRHEQCVCRPAWRAVSLVFVVVVWREGGGDFGAVGLGRTLAAAVGWGALTRRCGRAGRR